MNTVKIVNRRTGAVTGDAIRIADTFWARFRGLIGKPPLRTSEGLLLTPCRQIHTFWMKYTLSVWFLDKDYRILAIIDDLPPRHISPLISGSFAVLELPAGTASKNGDIVDDYLELFSGKSALGI